MPLLSQSCHVVERMLAKKMCTANSMTPSLHIRREFHRRQQDGGGYEDVSPEDLFNMFFGGMPGTANAHSFCLQWRQRNMSARCTVTDQGEVEVTAIIQTA